MRNNINLVDPDMDLVGILTTIWEGKIKIILILFFSVLVSYVYYSKQPKLFNTSIVIKQIQYKELVKFYSINELINEFHKSTKVITQDQNTKSYLESITSLERFVSEVMDYEELCEKLKNNKIAGAILDVFTPEPLDKTSKIWDTPNLIITPHVSSDDNGNYVKLTLDIFVKNLKLFIENKNLSNQIDKKLGY